MFHLYSNYSIFFVTSNVLNRISYKIKGLHSLVEVIMPKKTLTDIFNIFHLFLMVFLFLSGKHFDQVIVVIVL